MKRSAQSVHFKAFWIRLTPPSNASGRPQGPTLASGGLLPTSMLGMSQAMPTELSDLPMMQLQTVIPKRLLKKAVDRNGLRRIMREALRAQPRFSVYARAQGLHALRMTLINAKSFKLEPSRHALKLLWRTELDGLLVQLAS